MHNHNITVIHHRSQNTPSRILNQSCLGHMRQSFCVSGINLVESSIHEATTEMILRSNALIITGAMESVNDNLAWIRQERMLLDLAIEMSIPILGICFGAQHLAQALGAEVVRMTRPVIGLTDVEQCQPNILLSDLTRQFKAIGIHQDHILPCDHINVVAQSGGVVSAFTSQDKFFGLQFHPELTNQLLFDLLEKRVKLEFDSQELRDDALWLRKNVQLYEAHLEHVANSIAKQFLLNLEETTYA